MTLRGGQRTLLGMETSPVRAFSLPPGPPSESGVHALRLDGPFLGRAHVHRFFELLYLEEGASGSQQVGDLRLDSHPGLLVLVPPGEVHDPTKLSGPRWVIGFRAEVLGASAATPLAPEPPLLGAFASIRSGGPAAITIPEADRARWSARFERLLSELEEADVGHQESVRALLTLVLVDVARLFGAEGRADAAPAPAVRAALEFIDRRYSAPIGLQDVARAAQLSPTYLAHLMRRATGRSALEWITERRLAEARRLLLETDLPVGAVAEQIGYLDPGHFIQRFRRAHGHTPERWRRARRAG